MTEAPRPVQLVCPVDGSDRIISWEQATVGYRGVRFFQNPDDPNLDVIVDYDGVYDTEHADGGDGGFADDLMCGDCSTMLASMDLVPEGTEPNPDWERPPAEPEKPSPTHVVAQLRTWDAEELLRLAAVWIAAAESDSNDAEHDAGYDLVETLEPFARRVIELLAPMIPTEEETS